MNCANVNIIKRIYFFDLLRRARTSAVGSDALTIVGDVDLSPSAGEVSVIFDEIESGGKAVSKTAVVL
jgi:hypothetical protein